MGNDTGHTSGGGHAVPAGIDPLAFRQTLGAFVTGVTVITTIDADGSRHGLTANSFNSVSLDPPLILWSLRLNARSFPVFDRAERFVVHILAEDQVEISNRFAKPMEDRFADLPVTGGLGGLPVIEGCAAHLECRKEAAYPGGDHMVFLGRVESISNSRRRPLAYGAGRYMVVHPHDLRASMAASVGDEPSGGSIATLAATHLARPVLEELGRETGQAVCMAVWGNLGPTVIWWAEAGRPSHLRLRPGIVFPLSRSATGLLFAAHLPRERTEALLRAEVAADAGKQDLVGLSRDWLYAALDEVRRNGYGFNAETGVPPEDRTLHAFSAPVFNDTGAIVMALSMVGDAAALEAGSPAVARLTEAARGLSRRFGHKG